MRTIRVVRFLQEMSQSELAARAGLNQTTVSKAERGLLPNTPAARDAKLRICAVLGVVPPDEGLIDPKS